MKEKLLETMANSSLAYGACEMARSALAESTTTVTGEARIRKDYFERTYSARARHLAELGRVTWNFQDLLQDVRAWKGEYLTTYLAKTPGESILIVLDGDTEVLVGCAAFSSTDDQASVTA